MNKLKRETAIEIDTDDLAMILTETFCERYTPFADTFVDNILLLGDGRTFKLILSVKETEAA